MSVGPRRLPDEPRSGLDPERVVSDAAGLRVRWFDAWADELDAALRGLPELEGCPSAFYRALMTEGAVGKRAALVTLRDQPVAVPILRRKGRIDWEPVTQWLLPRALFPVKHGFLMPVLEALRVDISVGWWRWGTPPPSSKFVTDCERSVTFGADLTLDYEQHWRSTRHHKDVRSARNRCRGLTLSVDSPGAAEWTTRNWARVWSVSPAEVLDRLQVNKALERASKLHTHLLSDGGEPIAGATGTVDGTTFVAGVLYRDPGYESRNVGTALIDHVFRWAAQAGYSSFDLGGGHAYKERWAPESGERWSFKVCASSLCWARRGLLSFTSSLRRVLGRRPTH